MTLKKLLSGSKYSFVSERILESDYPFSTKAFSIPLTGRCNLQCPYCIKLSERPKMQEMTVDVITDFVELLGNTPCVLTILGGEPTLHPRFNDFLQLLKSTNYEEIIVLSNGTIPITPVDGVTYSLTYHRMNEFQRNCFIKNCLKIKLHGCKLRIELASPDPIFEKYGLKKYVRQLWIDGKPEPKFAENIHSEYFWLNGRKFSTKDILKLKLNKFKGWKCLVHDFEVLADRTIKFECTDNIIRFDEFEPDKDYWVRCPYEKCSPECLLEAIKVKT